ncbi:hypothetical protein RR48_13777 [Papilio machaon]|uniref:Uncharacterized protein n=1 Tax=Papilio machaon TaxID=76193 RepID=A0A194RLR1_PAPMA|nr:hypothetical protein RR48_13777 [Papilio machaon]
MRCEPTCAADIAARETELKLNPIRSTRLEINGPPHDSRPARTHQDTMDRLHLAFTPDMYPSRERMPARCRYDTDSICTIKKARFALFV